VFELLVIGGALGSSQRIAHAPFIVFLFFERRTKIYGKWQTVKFADSDI
jgi:hypothetical protein